MTCTVKYGKLLQKVKLFWLLLLWLLRTHGTKLCHENTKACNCHPNRLQMNIVQDYFQVASVINKCQICLTKYCITLYIQGLIWSRNERNNIWIKCPCQYAKTHGDKCVLGLSQGDSVSRQMLWPDKDETLVLVLTHCENICLLNYANACEVVSTLYLTRGGARLRLAAHYWCDKVFKAFVNKGLKCVCVCVAIWKQRAAVNVWTPSGWQQCTKRDAYANAHNPITSK